MNANFHCPDCELNRTQRHAPYGEMKPIITLPKGFRNITIDFILTLPGSRGQNGLGSYAPRGTQTTTAGGYSSIKTICFRCCQEGGRVDQCANYPAPVADQDRVKRRLLLICICYEVHQYVQPIALLACERIGVTLPICWATRSAVEKKTKLRQEPILSQFTKALMRRLEARH